MISRGRASAAVLCVVLGLVLAGCTSSSTGGHPASGAASSPSTSPSTSASGASGPQAPPAARSTYVSIGDSYAAGYQATAKGQGHTTTNGFADRIVPAARARGYDLTLVNFGCSGATTQSVLHTPGCSAADLAPGAAPYDGRTQAAAAEAYLRAHRGEVGLITVVLGGNDVLDCGLATNPIGCLTPALARVKANLTTLLTGLRAAAGPDTRIVGITYPDVLLGNDLLTDPTLKSTAALSVVAFKSLVNPALAAAYRAAGGTFVDTTAATGAYGSLTATTTLAPYGTIPVPVAKICTLTFFCEFQDIHPRDSGYDLIANLVADTLPRR